ncbi:sperm associated antigen 9a isoform X3 [Pangasianodon hypophthalmus]|uniref:sperm associated antigen 9a isoform X3 n=1 Tax=Pangasianodon hypophthalmus TaxID=310915 RepID=UPI002307254F|nr:sperm associated antigen 9a isoform X3 [Pangasianodon hypophthalmus]
MELEDGVVYQDDTGTSAIMSERVSGLASSIYREFERLIGKYDEDVVKELMPLVVAVLENLDSVFAENQEHEVELELLKEDNEQLITQYEREKALRKHAEEKFIEFEDSQEQEKKDLQNHVERMNSQSRQLELKLKNFADQISRLEEREAELKKEYNALHQRHTEMIHNYMEHVERIKLQQITGGEVSDTGTLGRVRKERPLSLGIFPMSGGGGNNSQLPDFLGRAETPGTEGWRFTELSQHRSNASLKQLEAEDPPQKSEGNSAQEAWGNMLADDCKDELLGSSSVTPMSTTASEPGLDCQRENGDGSSRCAEVQAAPGTRSISTGLVENEDKSDVQAIIESTPELHLDLSGYKGSSTPTKGIENKAFNRNTDSLFEELSSAGSGLIGDVDEGADLLGMGREVENLILENTQLLETKNALNVVKNDLIVQVDELTSEKEVLQGELDTVLQTKAKLEERNKELEEEIKKVRAEMESSKLNNKEEDESDVPTAQRRRFTRVEMARVLMERNQYKERLMELQEAVRWTEMIRASRENPALTEKKKSSIWQFFSRLFSSSSSSSSSSSAVKPPPSNVKYNPPSGMRKSSTFSQFPTERSKAFDFLNDEVDMSTSPSRREQKKAQYRQVKAHVQKEDGRMAAHGWSLPSKYKEANGRQAENKMNLPVPVYLRPLTQKDPSMKLWCAAGVNLSGGKPHDAGSGVCIDDSGAEGEIARPRKGSQSSLDQQEQEHKEREVAQVDMSSHVWICTSTQSSTKVIILDMTQPSELLDSFYVCNSHVLCIASVPGVLETDYPAGEEVPQDSEARLEGSLTSSLASNSSHGSEGALSGISAVGCTAEGTGSGAQTGSSGTNELLAELSPVRGRVELSREPSPSEDGVPTAEEATEATEEEEEAPGTETSQPGIYTEHVFTDPLGAQPTESSTATDDVRESGQERDGAASPSSEQDQVREEIQRMRSTLPTMWLGAQNGCLYVHSSVARWRKCLHAVKLKDSILNIVHVKGRVLVALADGTLAIFHRGQDGQWDLTNYHLLDLGRPHHSIRCMSVVHDKVWCGYRNKIYIVHPKAMKIEKSFDAHPRKESQVRQLAWVGDGIWVSIRLDSTLRLFHAHTFQHLQDVDIEPYVSKMLGTGKLGFSFVRITALMVSCKRLWVGTGNGVIISIPLSESLGLQHGVLGLRANRSVGAIASRPGGAVRVFGDESVDSGTSGSYVPYCSMAHAQLCFHGHRDAVKFFVAVPGQVVPPAAAAPDYMTPDSDSPSSNSSSREQHPKFMLVMSGGEGYIDFRMGDEDGAGVAEDEESLEPTLQLQSAAPTKTERSHIIVWQVANNDE